MMQKNYTVASASMTTSAARAIIQGREMVATVDAFEVELVAELSSDGGVKLRYIGDEIDAAKELFTADSKITAVFGRYQKEGETQAAPAEGAQPGG